MSSYVVTGTSRGIGLALVKHLIATSSENVVFALARKPEDATELQELSKSEKNLYIVKFDLDDRVSIRKAADEVGKLSGGSIDVLINNGALLYHERNFTNIDSFPDDETLENDLLTFFKTNAVGVALTINAFLPLLRAPPATATANKKLKKIIIISSGSGSPQLVLTSNNTVTVAYGVSKAAANMLVAKYACTLKGTDTSVEGKNDFVVAAVGPTLVKTLPQTPENDAAYEGIANFVRMSHPSFKGPMTPAESAKLVMEIVDRLTPAETGTMLHTTGADINSMDF